MVFKQNNNLLLATIILGLFTSLWNHAVTCNIAKYTDRVMMGLGLILNLLIISTCLYLSHLILTINHLVLMEYFSNSRKMIIIYINVPSL